MTLGRFVAAVILGVGVAGVACRKSVAGSSSSTGASQSSSGGAGSTGLAAMSSSGGTTQGTTSGTGSTSTSGGGSAGTTGTSTGSPFVDGGYVFCALPNAADAGPHSDGGLARWMCQPGTYFCDLSGNLGNCLQCRSDADCANQGLPTYDSSRQRCDLDSGIPGYQNFCVQCLTSGDCVGNPAGSLCDFNPTFPPFEFQPEIEDLGFETCGQIQTDCRLAGGPICIRANQVCDPYNGQCVTRSTSCTTDQDCAGLLAPSGYPGSPSIYLPLPYCVNGTCNSCDAGVCPNNNACQSDADCGNPTSSATGLRCEPFADGGFQCACTGSSQCGGFWPACVGLDGGNFDDASQPIGVCSCDSDSQCGDGGLVCLPAEVIINGGTLSNISGFQAGSSFCGVPCTSPDFASCQLLGPYDADVCDVQHRVCSYCVYDEQCASSVGSGGPFCTYEVTGEGGPCICILDSDCPVGFGCSGVFGSCIPIPNFSRCTPDSCPEAFCNWDSGSCNVLDGIYTPNCLSDFDCPGGVCVKGACAACRENADCVVSGQTPTSFCCLDAQTCTSIGASTGRCIDFCVFDSDCLGNLLGPSCSLDAGLHMACGCHSDTDCSPGLRCAIAGSDDAGACVNSCPPGGCPASFRCDSSDVCRPECNRSGDCDGGLGCSANACQPCVQSADCDPGTYCLSDGLCRPSCDAGACPAGEVCDGLDQAGNGPNICYQCVSPADCPNGQGCNHESHACGSCLGPNANGGPLDCPPDAICSNYWSGDSGVCLQNCDRQVCPPGRPICAAFPPLTPDHKYCFGCLQDSDCGDAGSVCDESFNRTFTCRSPG